MRFRNEVLFQNEKNLIGSNGAFNMCEVIAMFHGMIYDIECALINKYTARSRWNAASVKPCLYTLVEIKVTKKN